MRLISPYSVTTINQRCRENMKEFNLEEAKAGKPVICRNGQAARIVCYDLKSGSPDNRYPLGVLVTYDDGEIDLNGIVHPVEEFECYSVTGETFIGVEHIIDLFMKPMTQQSWVNVYIRDGEVSTSYGYNTEQEALDNKGKDGCTPNAYVDTIQIEYEV